ncbi:4756_t:CDS:2 [Ambispora gerdemannii]|uniref:Methylated-DNA--protein-cysteine methyltransferase n=1 Tax=Ambispora gerdemannii TaxID=144530 RepID=A0A9N9CM29_9GLOM|nr:4756_t:CDS:2 [Ambispora gerdemannii]
MWEPLSQLPLLMQGCSKKDYILTHLLSSQMFTDTENPVCLALFCPSRETLFSPQKSHFIYLYENEKYVGELYSLKKELARILANSAPKNCEIKFNDKNGNIGLCAIDNTRVPSIAFIDAQLVPSQKIKVSSRHLTRISIKEKVDLDLLNKKLARIREFTQDFFLTPFRGLRKDVQWTEYLIAVQMVGVSHFRQKVYNCCSQIPSGQISTYKGIAQFLNISSRVVGQVLKNNPYLSEKVPCHRVIASNYFIGGFRGEWGEGEKIREKKEKLASERIFFDEKGYLVKSLRGRYSTYIPDNYTGSPPIRTICSSPEYAIDNAFKLNKVDVKFNKKNLPRKDGYVSSWDTTIDEAIKDIGKQQKEQDYQSLKEAIEDDPLMSEAVIDSNEQLELKSKEEQSAISPEKELLEPEKSLLSKVKSVIKSARQAKEFIAYAQIRKDVKSQQERDELVRINKENVQRIVERNSSE